MKGSTRFIGVWGSLHLSLCAVAMSTSSPATSQQATYFIHLKKDIYVGYRATFEFVRSQMVRGQTDWADGRSTKYSNQLTWHLIVDYQITQLNQHHQTLADHYRIKLFTLIKNNGAESAVLPPGTQIDVKSGGTDGIYTVDGKSPVDPVAHYLPILLPAPDPQHQIREDLEYGTNIPRHMGEQWDIDPAAVAAVFSRLGGRLHPHGITGTAHLVDQELYNDIPCLRFEVRLNISSGYFPKPSTLPSNPVEMRGGSLNRQNSWLIPVDQNLNVPWMDATSSMQYDRAGTCQGRKFVAHLIVDDENVSRMLNSQE
jgi:hypothetical protein